MAGPRDYSTGTRAALAALSKGHCYYPRCTEPTIVFVEGEPIVNYQIAHIYDANPGNRYVEGMSDDERRSFKNLLLLCKPHHEWVDKTHPERFPSDVLQAWKEERETSGVAELRGVDGLTEERLGELLREALSVPQTEELSLEWTLDEGAFEETVARTFRSEDDITLRRFLERCSSDWRSSIDGSSKSSGPAFQVLDRVTCLAAYAIRWDRAEWAAMAVDLIEDMFADVLSEHGSIRPSLVEPGHRLLMAIANRILGLGVVAMETKDWTVLVDLVVRRPKNLHPIYSNWIRNATTEASRAGALEWTDSSGRRVRGSYLELALLDIAEIRCLNHDAPENDGFRTRLAGVDAVFTLAVMAHAPGDRDVPYYPWHRAYEPHRYEPAIVELLLDDEMRQAVFPGDDVELARVLLDLERFGRQEMAGFDGGWPHVAPEIQAFVARQREREEHAELVDSVLRRAQETNLAVPVSRSGHDPVVVTYSSGQEAAFVSELTTYKRLMAEGRIDHRTSRHGKAPRAIGEWSLEELRAWLAEH